MYVHLQSARVFPNDATSDSFPTSPSSPLLQNPFLASKISLGFYFVFFGVIVPGFSRQSFVWWEDMGSAGARAGQAEGSEMLTLWGDLAPACRSVCNSVYNPPLVRTPQQVRNNIRYLHAS